MKKMLMVFGVSAALLLGGCAESTVNPESTEGDSNDAISTSGDINTGDENQSNQSGNENDSNSDSDGINTENVIYGEVYEVIGNMLVLDIIEMPEGFSAERIAGMTSDGMREFRGFNTDDMTEEEIQEMEKMRESFQNGEFNEEDMQVFRSQGGGNSNLSEEEIQAMQERFQNGEMPSNFQMGEGAVFFGDGEMVFGDASGISADGEQVPQIAGQRGANILGELNYTGEQREIIIPVGFSFVSYSFTDGELTETEIDSATIKSGSVVMINYNDNGSIEKALLVK